jgi:hypothetical protein
MTTVDHRSRGVLSKRRGDRRANVGRPSIAACHQQDAAWGSVQSEPSLYFCDLRSAIPFQILALVAESTLKLLPRRTSVDQQEFGPLKLSFKPRIGKLDCSSEKEAHGGLGRL